jgi:hypothetical protein
VNISDRIYNVTNILSRTSLYKSFIGLLQRMTDTGDKAYAELEDIKVEMAKTNELLEEILNKMRVGRWK